MSAVRINRNSQISVAGMRHRQMCGSVRDNPVHIQGRLISEARDADERRARKFGHKLLYCFATANALSDVREEPACHLVSVRPGDDLIYMDEEGQEHAIRLRKPRWNDECSVEYVSGPFSE